MCQSVCVSLHLFKINLKFLKDHNYWLAQFLHISLVSVCVSMDLFRFNVKFLKTHNYWLGQLFHMSLVSGLELKTCRMHIKILRNSSKKKWWGRHYCQLLGQNSLVTNLNSYCYYDHYVINSVIWVVVKFCWLTSFFRFSMFFS